MLKRLLSMTLLLLALSSLLTLSRDGAGDPGGMPPWRQSAEASGRIQLIAGPTTVSPQIKGAVQVALAQAGEALPAADHYAITDLRPAGDWTFVSLVALTGLGGDLNWNLGDASWAGLVLLYQSQDGSWDGALAGTAGFSDLLAKVPDGVLAPAARAGLDPLTRSAAAAEPYIFPWELGTDMLYGISGVHTAGFIAGWKAVDFLSDGNTAVLNAPNRLLAAASGSISYVCRDSVNVAIRIGDLFYVHLIDNSNLTVGHYFDQSEELGQLKTGSFGDYCGWASQSSNWFHVHWGFPDTGTFTAGGWTLDLSDELWRRDGEVKGVGSWFRAEIGDYTVQGRVTDHTYTPISGVTVAAGTEISATTGATGRYTLTLPLGTHAVSADHTELAFWPSERTVELPPDAAGQDFVALARPVTVTLVPAAVATLVYSDTQGLTTTLEFPAGAVGVTTTLVLTPTLPGSAGPAGTAFAGHAFELAAYQAGVLRPELVFSLPLTVTVHYSELDVRLITDTGRLDLYWRTGVEWGGAAASCDPPGSPSHNLEQRRFSLPVCRTGALALFGPTRQTFLPLVLRGGS